MNIPDRIRPSLFALAATLALAAPFAVLAETRDIFFPTEKVGTTFRDDFGEPRYGHAHEGNDILGKKMMNLYAAVDGYVRYIVFPEENWGYAVILEDGEGYTYHYLHVNNDTPGTDDGQGGYQYAYGPGIDRGARVTRGQVVGYMGDSGNAENVGPHLHFEIRRPDGTPISPYMSLIAERYKGSYSAAEATAESPDINSDKALTQTGETVNCISGSRIKSPSSRAVYFCGADGKRYVFTNDRAYYTWFKDFNGVINITDEQLGSIRIGGNVTYRPGVKMIKIQSDPKVYAVAHGGVLRWITTAEIAASIYGADWPKKVDDVSDAFFINYTIGEPITATR